MPKIIDCDWAVVRQQYETTDRPVNEICAEHGISSATLYTRALAHDWEKRVDRNLPHRPTMVQRLMRMVEREIGRLEEATEAASEKGADRIGNLTRTLERLMSMDAATKKQDKPNPRREREMAEIKRKLAARLEQLRQD